MGALRLYHSCYGNCDSHHHVVGTLNDAFGVESVNDGGSVSEDANKVVDRVCGYADLCLLSSFERNLHVRRAVAAELC